MQYYGLETCLQVLFDQFSPLNAAQTRRLAHLTTGTLLAGNTALRKVARQLSSTSQQDSRVRWLSRTLQAPWLSQTVVYQALIRQALAGYHAATLHIVLDRTTPAEPTTDLLSATLSFRGRAVPLAWEFMSHGRSGAAQHQRLLARCHALLPPNRRVVVHGDSEFGSVALMRDIRRRGWQFILGISGSYAYRQATHNDWQKLSDLPITRQQSFYLNDVVLTRTHAYHPVGVFAFYHPRYANRRRRADIRYCATSMRTSPAVRRVGRRRWSIECCFKDFKSSGWQLHQSQLTHKRRRHGLQVVLSIAYLWSICVGRWLEKRGRRSQIDSQRQPRQLSLFRIGWDYIVHTFRNSGKLPAILTLYS